MARNGVKRVGRESDLEGEGGGGSTHCGSCSKSKLVQKHK